MTSRIDSSPDDLVLAFERDGFVNAGKLLTDAEVSELQTELEMVVHGVFVTRDYGPLYAHDLGRDSGLSHFQICGLWMKSEPFRRLIEHPRIVDAASRVMRSSVVQVWADTVQYKPPHNGAHFQWHQDAPYHWSTDPSDKLLGAWVALDDADETSGCMWMVPGSHLWGEQEHHLWSYMNAKDVEAFRNVAPPPDSPRAAEQFRPAVPRIVRAGEVHFHHALTWHGSPMNTSSRPRRAYTIHYMPEGMTVASRRDERLPFPPGTPMTEVGPLFPIVSRKNA
jgi:phytanoyl-CoA hydroxylase